MKKINKTIISWRTNFILFVLLPIALWFMGFIMAIGTQSILGLWGNLFYIPLAVNFISGLFFDTPEKKTSLFDRIPKKVKLIGFVVLLILILGVAPLLGVFSIVNFDVTMDPSNPISFSLTNDRTILILGSLLIICSAVLWVMILYASDAFRSIGFYIQHYLLSGIAFVATLVLLHRYFVTDDIFYLAMSVVTLMLCVAVGVRRTSFCNFY